MTDIADIGRRHLADALSGRMREGIVSEWIGDDGEPVKIYWRPVTGRQQREIDRAGSEVDRICATVKHRALDASGQPIFADTSLTSLANDYDYDTIRAMAYMIVADLGHDDQHRDEAIEQE